jgi:hypothetical protein
MGGSKYVGVEGFQQGKNFPYIHMTKAPWWEKEDCQIVEFIWLNTVCTYNKDKTKVTQLIPSTKKVVWTHNRIENKDIKWRRFKESC